MARLMLLMALCVLPFIVSATRQMAKPKHFTVKGRVYCDTCRVGFETLATTYISGAEVKIECKNRPSNEVKYTLYGVTDSAGIYKLSVPDDHHDDLCEAILVRSSQKNCTSMAPGRERACAILTRNNGMASDDRFVNNMGFMRDEPLSACTELLKQYSEDED